MIREIVKIRQQTGKTWEAVAKVMGTTTSVVGRLETDGGRKKLSPNLATLRKYVRALNCDLQLTLIQHKN